MKSRLVEHIAGVENDANFLTKTLGRVAFEMQRMRIMESRPKPKKRQRN